MSTHNDWTIRDLSAKSGVSTQYINRLLRSGELKGRKVGFMWIISDSEAKRWLSEREQQGMRKPGK